eukprot:m.16761 g.16761  ORF g.16761 m.16761 type:complete len:676 (+) comp9102_c0_seq1:452-2479(+)
MLCKFERSHCCCACVRACVGAGVLSCSTPHRLSPIHARHAQPEAPSTLLLESGRRQPSTAWQDKRPTTMPSMYNKENAALKLVMALLLLSWGPRPTTSQATSGNVSVNVSDGNWTRIAFCNGRLSSGVDPLFNDSMAIAALARNATKVAICDATNPSECVVSRVGTFPIDNLRKGTVFVGLNRTYNPSTLARVNAVWDFSGPTDHRPQLVRPCSPGCSAYSYEDKNAVVYQACGNQVGLHFFINNNSGATVHCTWNFQTSSSDPRSLGLWINTAPVTSISTVPSDLICGPTLNNQSGQHYTGLYIDPDLTTVCNVLTPAHCCELCGAEPRCNYWALKIGQTVCYLKTSVRRRYCSASEYRSGVCNPRDLWIVGVRPQPPTPAPTSAAPSTPMEWAPCETLTISGVPSCFSGPYTVSPLGTPQGTVNGRVAYRVVHNYRPGNYNNCNPLRLYLFWYGGSQGGYWCVATTAPSYGSGVGCYFRTPENSQRPNYVPQGRWSRWTGAWVIDADINISVSNCFNSWAPTLSPTTSPTLPPSANPTTSPTAAPTTAVPTTAPTTAAPTTSPTALPTAAPTTSPTALPTNPPTTVAATQASNGGKSTATTIGISIAVPVLVLLVGVGAYTCRRRNEHRSHSAQPSPAPSMVMVYENPQYQPTAEVAAGSAEEPTSSAAEEGR